MNVNSFVLGLALGLLMVLILNWIYFFDWMGLIGKLVSIISPNMIIKEIEDERISRGKEAFKAHQRKWKLKFLIVPVIFVASYLISALATRQIMLAYFCGLILSLVAYGILCSKEGNARRGIF